MSHTDKAGGVLWVNYTNAGLVAGGLITHTRETTAQIQKPKKDSQTMHNVK